MRGLWGSSIISLTITIAHTVSLRLNSNKTSAWRLFGFSSEAHANSVRPVMGLKVGRDTANKVVNTVAVSEMSEGTL